MGEGIIVGSAFGSIVPGVGTVIGGGLGSIFDIGSNIFGGGRSAEDISNDEQNSLSFHKNYFFRTYSIMLPDNVVAGILRPGWDAGENGTQLLARIDRYYNQNKNALLASLNSGGNTVGGSNNTGFNLAGIGGSGGLNLSGLLSNPLVLIGLGFVAFKFIK